MFVDGEIIVLDGNVVVYKQTSDLYLYMVGSLNENELILSNMLTCLSDTLAQIIKTPSIDRRSLLDNLDSVLLALDELIDNGIIMDMDSVRIGQRVTQRHKDMGDNFNEESMQQAFSKARDLARAFLS